MARPAPDPTAAEAAARLLASGRPAREAAEILGVRPNHVRRSIDRALRSGAQQHQAAADRLRSLRAAALGGDR